MIFISFLLTSISLSTQIHAYLFQSRFLYLYLFFIYPPIFFSIVCLSTSIMSISFNPIFFMSAYFSSIHLYLFLSLFCSPLSHCQSKFTPFSFNPVFFISIYSSYIHLYLFLSFVYPPLFLYTSLSIQINVYLFQPHFLHLSLILIYPPVSIFIPFLFTSISFYLIVNPIYAYLFQSRFLYLFPLLIAPYICFYRLSIHLYFFIPLCQSRLMYISFNPIFSISALPSSIHLNLFLSLFCLLLSLSISFSIQTHAYLFQSRFLYLCLFTFYFLYISLSIQVCAFLF